MVPSGIVPLKVDAGEFGPLPVLGHNVVLVQDTEKVVSVLLANVLHSKVVYNQDKLHRAPGVAP